MYTASCCIPFRPMAPMLPKHVRPEQAADMQKKTVYFKAAEERLRQRLLATQTPPPPSGQPHASAAEGDRHTRGPGSAQAPPSLITQHPGSFAGRASGDHGSGSNSPTFGSSSAALRRQRSSLRRHGSLQPRAASPSTIVRAHSRPGLFVQCSIAINLQFANGRCTACNLHTCQPGAMPHLAGAAAMLIPCLRLWPVLLPTARMLLPQDFCACISSPSHGNRRFHKLAGWCLFSAYDQVQAHLGCMQAEEPVELEGPEQRLTPEQQPDSTGDGVTCPLHMAFLSHSPLCDPCTKLVVYVTAASLWQLRPACARLPPAPCGCRIDTNTSKTLQACVCACCAINMD